LVFSNKVNLIHEIAYTHGNCGCLIENVDATDHRNALVRDEYNQVVKGILGQGYAFDAVAVDSYAYSKLDIVNLNEPNSNHSAPQYGGKATCFSFSRSICAGHPTTG
jgi:hypothetical protein